MIQDFFTTTFAIRRPVWSTDGEGNRSSELSTVGSFAGHLQQATPELMAHLKLSLTKAYTIWCPVATAVLEGDTIIGDGIAYSVKAIQKNDLGVNRHLQLVVELDSVVGS